MLWKKDEYIYFCIITLCMLYEVEATVYNNYNNNLLIVQQFSSQNSYYYNLTE